MCSGCSGGCWFEGSWYLWLLTDTCKKRVDIMLEKLGFTVHDKSGQEVKLSDYIEDEEVDCNGEDKNKERKKINSKGCRELRNLQ